MSDWRDHLNSLVYCYGCGRFGYPQRTRTGAKAPRGWTTLYQPHRDAPPMLLVCGDACTARVREAMAKGPIVEPLEMSIGILMSAEDLQKMREEMRAEAMSQLRTFLDEGIPIDEPPTDEPSTGGTVLPFRRRNPGSDNEGNT